MTQVDETQDEGVLTPEAQAELEKLAAQQEREAAAAHDAEPPADEVPDALAGLSEETVAPATTGKKAGKAGKKPFQTVKEKMKAAAGKAGVKAKPAGRKKADGEETAAQKKKREEREARTAAEIARKAKLDEEKAARVAERAARQTPDFLKNESKAVQAAAAAAFKESKQRRPKASREDFLAGWYTLFLVLKKERGVKAAGAAVTAKGVEADEPASDGAVE